MKNPPHASVLGRLGLACALFLGLSLAACQKEAPPGSIAGDDVELALKTLAEAPTHGFAPGSFNEQRIRQLSESKSKADLKTRDRLLYAALVSYSEAQHGLSIPKDQFPHTWGVRPKKYDAAVSLQQAVKEKKFKDWIAAQPPAFPTYQALQKAYVDYLNVSAAGGWPEVPKGVKLGATGPGVVALRQRLGVEDPLVRQVPTETPFDAALAQAVSRFQAAYGLKPTGQVDGETLKALNIPVITRAAQLRANLERLRWLPREEPPTRVDVNTAAQLFVYYEDGQPKLSMLSAAGKPGDETPMLMSKIDNIVLNPPWNVPEGIAQEELYPKGEAYLAANNFTNVDGRLVQRPGPESALGLVKFDFDNPYAVYLHDTPAKAAFNRSQRAVSHGCVRLQHALQFAQVLLSREPGWSGDRMNQVLASRETTTVKLSKPVPVRLMYLTAFPEAGRTAFRGDIYGWDGELLRLLDGATIGKVAQTKTPASARRG
ncbi:L,D-transpeptidase family protein [Phenylobacterium sp.]|jgi:murein L,D-transpeptidase YcbB/YkuD|uniref:L,D-transpeptidase family protein n=1 Tax=Phenylobacterium sp. TaxID=1871053 RepID=UPI002F949961